MQYWVGPSESLLGEGTVWTEFADDGHALRQVEKYGDNWYSSRNDSQEDCWLYEGNIQDLDLSESRQITREEFEEAWEASA